MEAQQKENYFQFYPPRATNSSHSKSRPHKQKHSSIKILPHIAEEYNYRITNHLLIKKIISPRRDKIIVQSLSHVFRRNNSNHSQHLSREKQRTAQKNKSLHNPKRKEDELAYGHQMNEEPKITVTPGKPTQFRTIIFNGRKTSPDKPINNLQSDSSAVNHWKEAKIRTMPPTRSLFRVKQNRPESSFHDLLRIKSNGEFGSGFTILKITHLTIDANPQIKEQALLELQLIERAAFVKQVQNVLDQKKQKTIKTSPLTYEQFPFNHNPDLNIKFAFNLTKIGDFVPLRIWRYVGVECVMVGTVDLPLISYGDDGQTENENKDLNLKSTWQQKKDNPNYIRKVLYGQIERRLLKMKMHQTDDRVRIHYKVYPKRFKKNNKDPKNNNDLCIES